MDKIDIDSKVRQIIAELGYVDDYRDVHPTDRLKEEMNFDSIDYVELGLELEEVFRLDVEISEAEQEKFLTVQNVIDYVNCHAS